MSGGVGDGTPVPSKFDFLEIGRGEMQCCQISDGPILKRHLQQQLNMAKTHFLKHLLARLFSELLLSISVWYQTTVCYMAKLERKKKNSSRHFSPPPLFLREIRPVLLRQVSKSWERRVRG